MSTEKGKGKMTPVEVEDKNFLEQCMLHNLNPKVVLDILTEQQKIARFFTYTVWPELEKQNIENYYSKLGTKKLHKKQAEMAYQSNMLSPINFDHGASPSLLEKMSTRLEEEMQMVKNLLEQCLVHYLSHKEMVDILYQKENIEPSFTKTVLQQLIEQNQEFFKHYYFMLAAKHQTTNGKFNALATTCTLETDRHRPGILGLQLQATPVIAPETNNQLSAPAKCRYKFRNEEGLTYLIAGGLNSSHK